MVKQRPIWQKEIWPVFDISKQILYHAMNMGGGCKDQGHIFGHCNSRCFYYLDCYSAAMISFLWVIWLTAWNRNILSGQSHGSGSKETSSPMSVFVLRRIRHIGPVQRGRRWPHFVTLCVSVFSKKENGYFWNLRKDVRRCKMPYKPQGGGGIDTSSLSILWLPLLLKRLFITGASGALQLRRYLLQVTWTYLHC